MISPPRRLAPWFLSPPALLGLVLLATGTATWFLMPQPKMTARTVIHVKSMPPAVLANANVGDANLRFLRSQVSLIKDPFIIRKALREPGIKDLSILQKLSVDPAKWLEEQIQVKIDPPEHLHITLSGDKPDELLALVKAVTRVYMSEVKVAMTPQREEQIEKLRKVKMRIGAWVKRQREELEALERNRGPALPELIIHQQKIAKEELKAAEADLVKIRGERRKAQLNLGLPQNIKGGPAWQRFAAALSVLPGPIPPVNLEIVGLFHNDPSALPFALEDFPVREPPEPDKAVVEEALDKEPAIAKLMAEIQAKKKHTESLRENAAHPEKNGMIAKLQKELDRLEKAAEKLRDQSRPAVIKRLREQMAAKAWATRKKDFALYAKLRETEDMLIAQVNRLVEEAKDTKKKINDINQLRKEIAGLEIIWKKAEEKKLPLEAEQEAPRRITWLGWNPDVKEEDLKEDDPEKRKERLNELREKDAAMILMPKARPSRLLATAAQVGLGMFLLLLAWMVSRAHNRPGEAGVSTPDVLVPGG